MIKNDDDVVQKHLTNSQARINRAIKYLLSDEQSVKSTDRRLALKYIDDAMSNLENAKDRLTRDWIQAK